MFEVIIYEVASMNVFHKCMQKLCTLSIKHMKKKIIPTIFYLDCFSHFSGWPSSKTGAGIRSMYTYIEREDLFSRGSSCIVTGLWSWCKVSVKEEFILLQSAKKNWHTFDWSRSNVPPGPPNQCWLAWWL